MAGSTARQALLLLSASTATSVVSASASGIPARRASSTNLAIPAERSTTRRANPSCRLLHQVRGGGSLDDDSAGDTTQPSETKPSKLKQKSKKKKARSKKTGQDPNNQSSSSSSSSSSDAPPDAGKSTDKTNARDASNLPASPPQTQQSKPPSKAKNKPHALPNAIQEILKHDDYYDILGLNRDNKASITERAIQKAYRRRCVLTHPDKTDGDRRAFDKVAEAYHVLSDSETRAIYDRYGKAGLEHGGAAAATGQGSFASADEFFQSFFGGAGGPSFFGATPPQQRARRNRTIRYQLEVSLEDLYAGMSQSIQIGAGGGSPLRKTVAVDIPRGALDGQSIRLSGEIDFDTTESPGDLIFLLKQRPHPVFTRKGHDLAVIMTVSLQEAVCGVKRKMQHLNGEQLVVGSARKSGSPVRIQTGDVHVLRGKGMPKNKLATSFGDLYIQYQVELPVMNHDLTEEERSELTRLLNKLEGKQSFTSVDEFKVQYSEPAKASDFGHASGTPPPLVPEEDELHHPTDGGGPFARRGFFYSSNTGREFPFGFPFEQEGEDAQCRQM